MLRRPSLLLGVALAAAALELATAWTPSYGLYHDELYYWAGAQRLGRGYVDHPPLESWHPESSRATGVSEFPVESSAGGPVVGRAMVVLRRR